MGMVRKLTKAMPTLAFIAWAGSVSAVPISGADIVTVDGTDWAQVDLFINLSWDEINAVCPSGVCVDSGVLNGYTMTGWIWASIDNMNALFNDYLITAGLTGFDLLGPSGDSYADAGSSWAPAFFADGWRPTLSDPGLVVTDPRWTSVFANGWAGVSINASEGSIAGVADHCQFCASDSMTTNGRLTKSISESSIGGWFYKSASPAEVPVPTTLALFGLGLVGLGWTQRQKA